MDGDSRSVRYVHMKVYVYDASVGKNLNSCSLLFTYPYAQRLHQDGPDNNAYYHELFLRGKLSLVGAMSRLVSPGKRLPW